MSFFWKMGTEQRLSQTPIFVEDNQDGRFVKQSIESGEAARYCSDARQLVRSVLLFFLLLCFAGLQDTQEVGAQGISPSLQVLLDLQVGGLSQPVQITNAGDGSGRLFVVEQLGRIRIIKNGTLVTTPFLDISPRVSCCGERGLLSVSFPPDYATKGYFYVDYTDINGDTVVARYHATGNPDVAEPDSEEVLLTVTQPFSNHNGGQLAFGPDGFLYIGMGDGGSGGDPNNYAQNLNDLPGNQKLLGKLLRIDVESGTNPYGIPSGNPVLNGTRSEIWALGLRNPWRFSFDRSTGDLYLGDVGQNSFEEVDFQPASSMGGENYGWRIMEGFHCYNPAQCVRTDLTLPVAEYDHTEGCSITGGSVYRGQISPLMHGIYFYGDFCTGRIWGLKHNGTAWQTALFVDTTFNITAFGEDESGELYVADYTNGRIFRMHGSDASPAADLWQDATDVGNGWKWLDWFGYFNTNSNPWIYHQQHGWLYTFGTSTANLIFWDPNMNAFWWTSHAQYPFIYGFSDGAWLFYEVGSSNPRRFYNLSTGKWESF